MKPKIFISAFPLDLPECQGIPEQGIQFVKKLEQKGFRTHMPLEMKDYSLIEKEIDACHAVIALVDEYWTSSTWKLSELTYALDGVGSENVNVNHIPLPTFVFFLSDKVNFHNNWTKNKPIILSTDIGEAVSQVEITMESN